MAKRAVEHLFTGTTTPYTSYDSSKTVLGALIQQKTGATATDYYAGPAPVALARPMEQSTAIAGVYPHVISWSSTIDWVFLADNSTAAATRRVLMYSYNKTTQVFTWNGFITLTYPTATNHTIRGMRVVRSTYSTGTVSVSGTTVSGSGTAWATNRFAGGARIGFGTTDPTAVTTWYYLSSAAAPSDTSITLSGTGPTLSSGTSYVIEELRVYTTTTNATAANGGLFVAKGINADDFASGGTTIAAATTTDNIKAVYWMADAATVLNTAAGGLAISATVSNTSHYAYVINADSGTSLRIYKYDLRASLGSLSSGKSTSAFVLRTGAQTVTGTISQTNASRMATLSHGPGSGTECLYTVTTTRILRIPAASIIDSSTTFVADSMVEIPPGSTNTFAATSAFTSVEYASTIDRFIVTTGSGQRHYMTQYNTVSSPIDNVFFSDNKQIDQSAADSGLYPMPATQSAGFSVWVEGGIGYFVRLGTTAIINQLYAFPIGAHWDTASGSVTGVKNRLITPSLDTTGAKKFYRVYVNSERILGSENLGIQPEPYRLYFRTSGISDDSGSWTQINDAGDLTGITPASEIQFMFEFKTAGITCVPARIFGLTVTYEDDTTDSHYQPSVAQSDIANKRFAWRFSTAFGSTVPTLYVRLYDAVSGALLLTDTTASPTGTWEKSTDDGSTWGSYNTTDLANDTTYVRYTPASLGSGIKVRALLSQS